MKQAASKLNGRTWHKPMSCASSLIKLMAAPLLILAILICTARPASAQQSYQKVYVDHNNPTYVVGLGWTVGIQVEGDECPYPHPTASVTDITVGRTQPVPLYHPTLSEGGDGVWWGDYTAWWAGTFTVTAQEAQGCDETFLPVSSLTVVSIDDITVQSEPVGSGWTRQSWDANDYLNNVALKAATTNPVPVVTFHVDITPPTAEAATFVVWCNHVTPSLDNMTATLPATDVSGPLNVFVWPASHEYYVGPIVSWVFWVNISVNTSGAFDGDDNLDFSKPQFAFPLSPGQVAGPFAGQVTKTFSDCQCGADVYCCALTKVEIKGTLKPPGVGNVIGNNAHFSFNTQQINWRSWESALEPVSPSTWPPDGSSPAGNYVPDISCSGALTFTADITQQVGQTNDKIFALDSPGKYNPAHVLYGYTYDAACAQAFKDQVFVNGDNGYAASDVAYWHNFVVAGFSNKNGAQHVAMYYSAGQDNAPIPLPSLFYPADPNSWGTLQYIEQE